MIENLFEFSRIGSKIIYPPRMAPMTLKLFIYAVSCLNPQNNRGTVVYLNIGDFFDAMFSDERKLIPSRVSKAVKALNGFTAQHFVLDDSNRIKTCANGHPVISDPVRIVEKAEFVEPFPPNFREQKIRVTFAKNDFVNRAFFGFINKGECLRPFTAVRVRYLAPFSTNSTIILAILASEFLFCSIKNGKKTRRWPAKFLLPLLGLGNNFSPEAKTRVEQLWQEIIEYEPFRFCGLRFEYNRDVDCFFFLA